VTPNPCYVARSRKIAARLIGDEMMVMSGADSTLFTLNPTATIIWQAADGVTPLEQIVDARICPAFDIDRDAALDDAAALVRDLAEHGILQVSPTPIPSEAQAFRP
jgi:hypothetical protein